LFLNHQNGIFVLQVPQVLPKAKLSMSLDCLTEEGYFPFGFAKGNRPVFQCHSTLQPSTQFRKQPLGIRLTCIVSFVIFGVSSF